MLAEAMLADLRIGPLSVEMPRARFHVIHIILDSLCLVHLYSKVVLHLCDSECMKGPFESAGPPSELRLPMGTYADNHNRHDNNNDTNNNNNNNTNNDNNDNDNSDDNDT